MLNLIARDGAAFIMVQRKRWRIRDAERTLPGVSSSLSRVRIPKVVQ